MLNEKFMKSDNLQENFSSVIDVCFNGCICGGLAMYLREKCEKRITIPFCFEIGNLKGDVLEHQREYFVNMFAPFGCSKEECDKIFEETKNDLNKIVSYAKKGSILRIWNDGTPRSICGIYFLVNLLSDVNCKIYEVPCSLDENIPTLDGVVELTRERIKEYSHTWDLLVEEDTPLRVLKDGVLISVEEPYFDSLILDIVGDKKISTPEIVGEILVNDKISDTFIFDRVYHLVNHRKLKIISKRSYDKSVNFFPYRHVVKKIDSTAESTGIPYTYIVGCCIAKQDFSHEWLEKEFGISYILADKILNVCKEMGIIERDPSTKILVTLDDYCANESKYAKILKKHNLNKN